MHAETQPRSEPDYRIVLEIPIVRRERQIEDDFQDMLIGLSERVSEWHVVSTVAEPDG
jgi:hypothetical protein